MGTDSSLFTLGGRPLGLRPLTPAEPVVIGDDCFMLMLGDLVTPHSFAQLADRFELEPGGHFNGKRFWKLADVRRWIDAGCPVKPSARPKSSTTFRKKEDA